MRTWLALLFAAACFWLGRHERPAPPATPPPAAPVLMTTVRTSTVGLCPCPAPRAPKKVTARKLARRAVPAEPTKPAPRPDPTKATAAYLRKQAKTLARCAPPAGAPLRVHLEVMVTPAGDVQDGRITNLEPVPGAVARCVLEALGALEPPGFDATEARRFGLTVVL